MVRQLVLAAASALLLAACNGEGDSAAVRIEPTAAAATPASSPTATATAVSPRLAPSPTQKPAPADAGAAVAGDLVGLPFSTADVRAAIEQAGFVFLPVEPREALCPGSAVPGRPYWTAFSGGTDFGPVFVLWVYPDAEALREDWEAVPGEAPRPRMEDCELPTGFVYWNDNLVLTFAAWLSLGQEFPLESHDESPGDHPAVRAFLELAP